METSAVVRPGEALRIEQEVWFDLHLLGSDTGYPSGGRAEIRRGSDGKYWKATGGTWETAQTWNATTVDAGGTFHHFDFTVPSDTADGDALNIRIQPTGDDTATHTLLAMVRKKTSVPLWPQLVFGK